MKPIDYAYIAIIAVLLVFSAFFSMSDMVYSSVSKPRLLAKSEKKGKRGKLALSYAEHYDSAITTLLFGNSLVNIIASSFAALLALDLFGEMLGLGEEAASLLMEGIMLFLVLLFGEILPKAIGKVHATSLAILFAPLVRVFELLFFPFVRSASAFARFATDPIVERASDDEGPSDNELQAMVDQIEEEGLIDSDQAELLENSIEFKETSVYEIMTPRVKVEGVSVDSNLKKHMTEHGPFQHSRILVYDGNYDHILGYIQNKVLLRALLRGENPKVRQIMIDILSVPRTMEISSVLDLMKKSQQHIVLVKDEYGGTEGIVTLEDILEELVGELYDESEKGVQENIRKTEKRNRYLVLGSMNVFEFFDEFGLPEEKLDEDYSTVSGWINDRLGRFAKVGDKFSYGRIDVIVKKASLYTVEEILVVYHPRRKIEED